jgi:hypothetical protein
MRFIVQELARFGDTVASSGRRKSSSFRVSGKAWLLPYERAGGNTRSKNK